MSKSINVISVIEAEKLLHHLLNPHDLCVLKMSGFRDVLMGLLMLDAGLRVSEVVGLTKDDLFFNGSPRKALEVRPEIAKRGVGRIIPLTSRLHTAIKGCHDNFWMGFPSPCTKWSFYRGNCTRPLSARQVQRIIRKASKESIGREIHPHVLRHTFATRLMRTTSIRIVQQLLGHKNLSSTQIYTHPNGEDLINAINGME